MMRASNLSSAASKSGKRRASQPALALWKQQNGKSMSARDKIHNQVVNALKKDGWTITHDPYKVPWKLRKVQIDLGAERLLAAEKGAEKIAVEIKSFAGTNDLGDLYNALGQFVLYRNALLDFEPDRTLFLAIDREAFEEHFDDTDGEALRVKEGIKLVVCDIETEEVVLWKR
jgi:hypothetical protein